MNKTAVRSLITSGLLLVAVAGLTWFSGGSVRSGPVVVPTATAESPEPVSPESLATEHRSETDVPTATATWLPELKPSVTSTSRAGSSPTPIVSPTSAPAQSTEETIGFSVTGRPIVAHRFGAGPIKIALVGNIHGGFEANTHVLANELIDHFQTSPTDVPVDVSLWIIPM